MEFIAIKRIQSTSTSSLKIKKSSSISGNIKVTFNSGRKKNNLPQNILMFGVTAGLSLPYSLTAKKHWARQTFPVACCGNFSFLSQ